MDTLSWIIVANVASTVMSIALAAWLSFRWLSSLVDKLVCVSAGLLLTVALTHLVPEALESGIDTHALGWVLLAGILGFFLLEKLALIHHTHHHEGDEHHHHHGHDASEARRGGIPILVGDAFHNFADGIVIAAAFVLDWQAGLLATAAVMAHEIPHEVGDFMILLNAGYTKRRAFVFNLLSGASAVIGGAVGYLVLDTMNELLPYALLLAAASFVYIALSDLLPELMRRSRLTQSLPQVGLVMFGVALAALISIATHAH
jgi:zinc and cadmium transporter